MNFESTFRLRLREMLTLILYLNLFEFSLHLLGPRDKRELKRLPKIIFYELTSSVPEHVDMTEIARISEVSADLALRT